MASRFPFRFARTGSPDERGMEMRPIRMTCVVAMALILVLPACGERGHTAATSGAPSHRPISATRFGVGPGKG